MSGLMSLSASHTFMNFEQSTTTSKGKKKMCIPARLTDRLQLADSQLLLRFLSPSLLFFFSFAIRSKPGKQVQEDRGTKEMGVPIFRNGSIPQSRATLKSLACPCSTSEAFPINSHNIILKWCFEFKNMLEITNKPFCLIPSLSSEGKGLPPGIQQQLLLLKNSPPSTTSCRIKQQTIWHSQIFQIIEINTVSSQNTHAHCKYQ